MTESEETAYVQGSRSAWRSMLGECLRQLGIDDPEAGKARWMLEREDCIARLRDVCGTFGDNDWSEDLYLADVIEKHLAKHLFSGEDAP